MINVYFTYAALVNVILVVVFLAKSKLPQTRIRLLFLLSAILLLPSFLFDGLAIGFATYPVAGLLLPVIFEKIAMVLAFASMLLYQFYFVTALFYERKQALRVSTFVLLGLFAAMSLAYIFLPMEIADPISESNANILRTRFTGLAATAGYFALASTVIVSVVFLVIFRKKLTSHRFLAGVLSFVFFSIGVFLQAASEFVPLLPNGGIMTFRVLPLAFSIPIFHTYLIAENAGASINRVTGLLNERFFYQYWVDEGLRRRRLSIAIVRASDNGMNGNNTLLSTYIGKLAEALKDDKKTRVFVSDIYDLIVTSPNDDDLDRALAALQKANASMPEYRVRLREVIDYSSKDLSEVDDPLSFLASFFVGSTFYRKIIEPGALSKSKEQKDLERRLRDAIPGEDLVLFLQPIFRRADGKPLRAEALARLRDSDGRLIPAGRFLSAVAALGYTRELDHIVIDKLLGFVSAHPSSIIFSANVSLLTLADPSFPAFLKEKASSYKVEPARLILEINDFSHQGDLETIRRCIIELREEGFHICLDSFGRGNANLNYLIDLPIDSAKLDKAVLSQYTDVAISRAMIASSLASMRALSIEVTIVGVDTAHAYNLASAYEVDYIQGDGLCRALSEQGFLQFLAERGGEA